LKLPIQDLRDWIDRVDQMGELTRVTGADPRVDVGGLTDLYQWEMGNPALLFDQLSGYPAGYRILSNGLTSLRRVALAFGLASAETPRDFVQALRNRVTSLAPVAAQWVDDGPILQNRQTGDEVDVTVFPAPVWHPGDGGPYLGTGDIVIMRDPDTGWVNAGTYRVQVHDAKTVGLYISAGKHGSLIRDRYWQRGEACPVAISIGHDPLLMLVGGMEVDYGTNEFDVAGGLRGEPLPIIRAPYTGLPVPASSEIVLEGEIPPDERIPEGPFGEWAGYYASGRRPAPIVRVRSVLHRDDPIVLGCLPGKPPNDNTFFRSPLRAALIWNELERAGIQGIMGAWSHEAGGGRLFNVLSIQQRYPGHAKQVGMAAASCQAGAYANRFVVVVDDDIDPTNTDEVIWALCTRTDVVRDLDVMRRCWSTSLDPMAYQGEGTGFFNDRLVIDACRPYDRLDTFPAVARLDRTDAARIRARWSTLFSADGAVLRDVRAAAPSHR
jgi:4-hydroxy-3-polyprenylbenzoate decarboxylase